uniref:Uncharacterized protein n=1 Tax=Anguilla anguilla TaxID=7936 RepID=A0A0E9VKE9_ANGAN
MKLWNMKRIELFRLLSLLFL